MHFPGAHVPVPMSQPVMMYSPVSYSEPNLSSSFYSQSEICCQSSPDPNEGLAIMLSGIILLSILFCWFLDVPDQEFIVNAPDEEENSSSESSSSDDGSSDDEKGSSSSSDSDDSSSYNETSSSSSGTTSSSNSDSTNSDMSSSSGSYEYSASGSYASDDALDVVDVEPDTQDNVTYIREYHLVESLSDDPDDYRRDDKMKFD